MALTIYHNPRCTKSRQTLALLEGRGLNPRIVHYLETPPSSAELANILKALGAEPRDIMRKKEAPYKDLRLNRSDLTNDVLIELMVGNPTLIERPIVVNDGKAAIGRPPEAVLEIL